MPRINHKVLATARDSAGLSREDAASKLQFYDAIKRTAVERLEALESGEEAPSRSVLKKLAKTYRVPLLTFYLTEIPTKGERGEDFRSLPEQFEAKENSLLDSLLIDIKARQGVLKQALIDEDEAVPLSFVASFDMSAEISTIVSRMRTFISFDLEKYRSKTSVDESFKYLRLCVEDAGIYVVLQGNLGSHHTDISVEVFRGFALADPIAPFIVVNDKDAKAAWSFTLLHELVHLALGRTGVSGSTPKFRIEKFCNDVASEFLLPESEFGVFAILHESTEEKAKQISDYARARRISASHVAYRLYKRGDIDKKEWHELKDYFQLMWGEEKARLKKAQKEQQGGPDYYVLRRRSLGNGLMSTVHRFMQSGSLSTTKAAMLLGVKPLKVHKLFDQ